MEARPGSRAATAPDHDGSGPYILRDLIKDIPLAEQEDGQRAHITCVDAWNGNLYVGTSAGQVLHYVSIPPDPADDAGQPGYIFATKLEPPYKTKQEGPDAGVKQILLLPSPGKAGVLCNGTLTFYTLPELSPAFAGKNIQQSGCLWVGGADNNELVNGGNAAYGTVIVICLRGRLRLIRIGDDARKIRDIELGGVRAIQRRQDLACVADARSYSLLDVVNHRKNELFPISSLTPPEPEPEPELQPPRNREPSRSFSARSPVRPARGHERNISLGGQAGDTARLRPETGSPWPARRSSRPTESPAQPSSREESPAMAGSGDGSARASSEAPRPPEPPSLPPNIVSPTPNEFLLTTGTKMSERGVGMFVNLEGDVVRGTIEFSSYPESLVLDGTGVDSAEPTPDQPEGGGYVLALVSQTVEGRRMKAIEVQRWDVDPSEAQDTKHWLPVSLLATDEGEENQRTLGIGLRTASLSTQFTITEISFSLRLRRLHFIPDEGEPTEAETKRNQEEDKFAARFSQATAKVLLYKEDKVFWVVRNAIIIQLEKQLDEAVSQSNEGKLTIDVPSIQRIFNSIRGQEARNELDFITLTYIRQKASLLLFGNLALQTIAGFLAYEHDKRRAEDALISGEIDPRTILSLVPPFADEVDEGEEGIWIPQGLRDTVHLLRTSIDSQKLNQDPKGDNLLQLIKRYLLAWRKKKGFGSVADEAHVFRTVDAALLHVLLMLDQHTPRGPATPGTVRAELNEVVDKGVECFERAKELFEQFKRLYTLSRLYQSRKMTAQVLATWRRIIEGEHDEGGELVEGEQDVRRYLTKLRDAGLVQEYGAWLANRNPRLGVQVFADETSRVKFEPAEAVRTLKQRAPGAVKDYLEHLVFGGKDQRGGQQKYVKDLIKYYLDSVLAELEKRDEGEAKDVLMRSYETYRALKPPKPTYRQFIQDNAIEAEWWRSRLRLLQLIGGSHGLLNQDGDEEKFDGKGLGERLAPYSDALVPEMIILNARAGKHEEALRLLIHGLGDYDTAIRYCLLGGSGGSIFHPGSATSTTPVVLPTKSEQSALFTHLLHLFLTLEDLSERVERSAELLERFAGWFDVQDVLALIPDSWAVGLFAGFFVRGLRVLEEERKESEVVKALASAQNLRETVVLEEKVRGMGPKVMRIEASGDGEVGGG
jgi:vacuolar protein sorting-associated protein 3